MRTKAKKDNNQDQVVAELRALGFSVEVLSQLGKGRPDLMIGRWGFNWLVELKSTSHLWLTEDEQKWHARWEGHKLVARSTREILIALIEFVHQFVAPQLSQMIKEILVIQLENQP